MRLMLTECVEKHLPALKCLLSAYQINPDHPKCHEQGCRFKLALDNLSEPLPPKVQEVINNSYLSKFATKSLEQCNEDYLKSHKHSPPHIQSVVRVRNLLKPGAEETKSKGKVDLESSVSLDTTSLQDAIAGLQLTDELQAGPGAREAYIQAAQKNFPEASVFQSSR